MRHNQRDPGLTSLTYGSRLLSTHCIATELDGGGSLSEAVPAELPASFGSAK